MENTAGEAASGVHPGQQGAECARAGIQGRGGYLSAYSGLALDGAHDAAIVDFSALHHGRAEVALAGIVKRFAPS